MNAHDFQIGLTGERVPGNNNLRVFKGKEFNGLKVLPGIGPFCYEYLQKLYNVTNAVLQRYSRVTAFRFDLKIPGHFDPFGHYGNELVSLFFKNLDRKVQRDRRRAKDKSGKAHRTETFYVWCRELDKGGFKPHWHCVLFVNKSAYKGLGSTFCNAINIRNFIRETWAEVLQIHWHESEALSYFCHKGVYVLERLQGKNWEFNKTKGLDKAFKRMSYLCKIDTKPFGRGHHVFEASRI